MKYILWCTPSPTSKCTWNWCDVVCVFRVSLSLCQPVMQLRQTH